MGRLPAVSGGGVLQVASPVLGVSLVLEREMVQKKEQENPGGAGLFKWVWLC